MTQPKERILFLYLSTGGGHLAAAKALAAELHHSSDSVETHLLDGIPRRARVMRAIIEGGYRFVTDTMPLLWPILYQTTTIPMLMHYNSIMMIFYATPIIRRYIRKHKITRIVSLHFLLNLPLFRSLRPTAATRHAVGNSGFRSLYLPPRYGFFASLPPW